MTATAIRAISKLLRPPDLTLERACARLGADLARDGHPDGRRLRQLALRSIHRQRRAYWRALVAERMELGYRDLGGEG